MKIFSPTLKRQIKDCLLALFWPKKDFYTFFKDCSVPAQTLKVIDNWEQKNLSRADMVDEIFNALSNQHDNGTIHFNIMLEALANWTHFDDFWFKEQKTLDLDTAKSKISSLKSSKEKNIDTAKKRVAQQQEKATALKKRHNSLEEMNQDFQKLSTDTNITAQNRGFIFEKFLLKMAHFFDLKVTKAFKIQGTQIDGTIKYDGENYIIEAKWHNRILSDEPLLAFSRKQEINMHGRGIFISINGFTKDAVSILERATAKNTVLMDGEDIALILNDMISLPEVLEKKFMRHKQVANFILTPLLAKVKFPYNFESRLLYDLAR